MKRVLPFAALAAVSASTYWSNAGQQHTLVLTAILFIFGAIVLWVLLHRGLWHMADAVEDHGDRLIITRWRTRIEVPIANVKELRRRPMLNGSNVTIVLTAPSALGSEITFLAPSRRTVRDIEQRLNDLSRRIASRG